MIKNILIALIIAVQTAGLIITTSYLIEESYQRFYYQRMSENLLEFTETMHRTVWGRVDPAYRCRKK